jgi:hypothetical protein
MAADSEIRDPVPTRADEPSPNESLKSTKLDNGTWRRVLTYFKREISLEHADIPIIACCLVSGLCDSSAYNAWTCFVSMQTGTSPLNRTLCEVLLTSL